MAAFPDGLLEIPNTGDETEVGEIMRTRYSWISRGSAAGSSGTITCR